MDKRKAEQLNHLIKTYKSNAKPSNHSDPIEYSDIAKLVDETAKLIENIVRVMEE